MGLQLARDLFEEMGLDLGWSQQKCRKESKWEKENMNWGSGALTGESEMGL